MSSELKIPSLLGYSIACLILIYNCAILFFNNVYLLSNVLLLIQEANTEKIFYGLDDVKEASDVIIVITILLLGIFS